jgi:hypothetical protein
MNLAFMVCLLVGVILVFVVSSLGARVAVAVCLLLVMVANIILRLTYFKNVLPEIRQERERRGR